MHLICFKLWFALFWLSEAETTFQILTVMGNKNKNKTTFYTLCIKVKVFFPQNLIQNNAKHLSMSSSIVICFKSRILFIDYNQDILFCE